MSNIIILLSHKLTSEQIDEIYNDLKLKNIIYLPDNLKILWSNIPPEEKSITEIIKPIKEWVSANTKRGDYIVIQGDMGATYCMINYAFSQELIPYYTTTKRITIDKNCNNGSINLIKQFKHIRFRQYEK